MKTYKIQLRFKSGILTPFHADTVFGHLCWMLSYEQGDEGVQDFLQPFKEGNPPFLLSDGFPGDYILKPLGVRFAESDISKLKKFKNMHFITLADFSYFRSAGQIAPNIIQNPVKTSLSSHNSISRLTNSTLAEGGFYSLEEHFTPIVSIYVKTVSEQWKDRVMQLFTDLSIGGYGRKKSIGKGNFCVEKCEEFKGFMEISGANGFVSLSHFCPAEKDPTDGMYKIFIKYGKLGDGFTFCGNAFKRPLMMFKPGAIFKTESKPRDYYGRLIDKDIAPAKPEVVQYAYAFAVPIKFPSLGGAI
jgi:CRISPR-associated protein Csm4